MKLRGWLPATAALVALLAIAVALAAPPAPAQPRTFVWKVQSAFPVVDYPHRSLVE
jgi:hypothetical protein